jgi:hypothetical protein
MLDAIESRTHVIDVALDEQVLNHADSPREGAAAIARSPTGSALASGRRLLLNGVE